MTESAGEPRRWHTPAREDVIRALADFAEIPAICAVDRSGGPLDALGWLADHPDGLILSRAEAGQYEGKPGKIIVLRLFTPDDIAAMSTEEREQLIRELGEGA